MGRTEDATLVVEHPPDHRAFPSCSPGRSRNREASSARLRTPTFLNTFETWRSSVLGDEPGDLLLPLGQRRACCRASPGPDAEQAKRPLGQLFDRPGAELFRNCGRALELPRRPLAARLCEREPEVELDPESLEPERQALAGGENGVQLRGTSCSIVVGERARVRPDQTGQLVRLA